MPAPAPVARWMQSVEDPWTACVRADWLIYVARARGVPSNAMIAALARCMPRAHVAPELAEIASALDELLAVLASRAGVPERLAAEISRHVKPQLIDWNVGRSHAVLARHGAETPAVIPQPPLATAEPLRNRANAVLRLQRAADAPDDECDALLTLVALYIVFDALGGGSPLYNHVEMTELPDEWRLAHETVCQRLRQQLH